MSSVLDELRAATAFAHQALDQGLDIQRRLRADPERLALIQGYFAMHEAAEAAMTPFLHEIDGLDMGSRCRAVLVRAALEHLGAEPLPRAGLHLSNYAEALGWLYVMEGSSLGGRTILRGLEAARVPTAAARFLDPYGTRAGAMWRELTTVLERELVERRLRDAAVAGAIAAFAFANTCLRQASARLPDDLVMLA